MRSTSFVARPSEAWVISAQALTTTTLFLVARVGPTVFTLKDENDGTFRVTLGNPHTCTCPAQSDTCIHKLFCLIKVLRVPMDHSLCYQTSLTDSELDQVLDGIVTNSVRRPVRQRPARPVVVVSEEIAKETVVPRQPIIDGEDNSCTICMDDMTADQALTWCRAGCGQNIHAKCMMKCAQHNITNRLPISCPLCRNPMDIDTLKQDCKGKASLKQTYAPVQCGNCKCNQRGTFYRCVECSQASCLGSGKPCDLCPECFERQQDPVHNTHHFVRSDIVTEASHGLEWTPCKNPALRGVITNPDLIRDLQTRELGVNDYDLLMQLSNGGPTLDLPALCVESLPTHRLGKNSKKTGLNLHCWCAAGQSSPARIRSHFQISSPITGAAVLANSSPYVSPTSPLRGNGGGSTGSSPNSKEQRTMRVLPCRHVAHDRCLREEITLLVEHDTGKVTEYRCSHVECGKRIFVGLSRKRRSRKSSTEAAAAEAPKPGELSRQGESSMAGVVGASYFGAGGSSTMAGGGSGDPLASSFRTNRGLHRRGQNSFGSGSDFSTGSGNLELGISGSGALGAVSLGIGGQAHRGAHRVAHLDALPPPTLTLRSEAAEYALDRLAGIPNTSMTGTASQGTALVPRRPPVGQRVRLRALGDATGAPTAGAAAGSGVVGSGARRQSSTASDAVLGLTQRRDLATPELLSSLSDRAPSPAPLPSLASHHHQRALSIGSRGFPSSNFAGRAQGGSASRVADVLVFNLSKESRQRQRERNRPPPPAFDPTLMVASVSLSNPAGGGGAAMGASTAGYALQLAEEGVGSSSGRHLPGRKPAGRIVRGLLSSTNRSQAAVDMGSLPTLR
jgi:hypothetical protein